MTAAIVPLDGGRALEARRARLVENFLAGKNPRTLAAYRADLADFAGFLGAPDLDEAARRLLDAGAGEANALVVQYLADLQRRGLRSATIARRLSAIRSLIALARTLGLVAWRLEVKAPRVETYRDTRGPGLDGFARLLGGITGDRPKDRRDRAILRTLFDLGLRRAEVAALDLADLDLAAGRLLVLGKGRTEKVPLSLPAETVAVLRGWLAARGEAPGPLFFGLDRARNGRPGRRLTGSGIWRIVRARGAAVGLVVRPHGLRHLAVTTALDVSGGDIRAVARFSRHRDLRTVTRYDDNRADLGGEIARRVAAAVRAA